MCLGRRGLALHDAGACSFAAAAIATRTTVVLVVRRWAPQSTYEYAQRGLQEVLGRDEEPASISRLLPARRSRSDVTSLKVLGASGPGGQVPFVLERVQRYVRALLGTFVQRRPGRCRGLVLANTNTNTNTNTAEATGNMLRWRKRRGTRPPPAAILAPGLSCGAFETDRHRGTNLPTYRPTVSLVLDGLARSRRYVR